MNEKNKKIYKLLRNLIYLASFLAAVFLAVSIIFPREIFTFNFENPRAAKNTLADPRNDEGQTLENGKVSDQEKLIMDAGVIGDFSQAQLKLFFGENDFNQGIVTFQKGFQAFLYPEGEEIGFPDGKLLKSGDNYYFISEGKLRRFQNENQIEKMGFALGSFQEVFESDLEYNSEGEVIQNDYPQGSIFEVEGQYYRQGKDGLKKFINPEAFFSFGQDYAILKDSKWLASQNVSPEKLGFASGTLLAYGTSAFIVADDLILPIGDATIFESKGFKWDDLVNVGGDTISFYEKGKLFELDSPHPGGTVFQVVENNSYYLIENGQKHLLPSEVIAKNWIRKTPTQVSKKSLERSSSCDLKQEKTFWGRKYLTCSLNVQNLDNILGTDYEFYIENNQSLQFSEASLILERNMNKKNLNLFISDIISRIKQHYDK